MLGSWKAGDSLPSHRTEEVGATITTCVGSLGVMTRNEKVFPHG